MAQPILTITDEDGNSTTLMGGTLNAMITEQLKSYNTMIERVKNNPDLTKQKRDKELKCLSILIDEVEKIIPMTYSQQFWD
jgi:hypothetical protein